ncbi:DNA glycosylase [Didymella exigua CBS 183.55]|uniref:Adenine DNA glycosylase n=1 Tax=Didymella exigua CBS 183.55 TaxID=1150837 RepID=A0A6A5RC32_9PLEO|nr:DNA glycosylase [Didymella exigua CBS 183.55]KAF1923317.1 DNA glycosylase [Didymella exigua CBS 183.55]
MPPRRTASSKPSKAVPTKSKGKPAWSIAFEKPERPLIAALPPARAHSPSYHFPLLIDNQSQYDALLDWFKTVEDSRTMPWRKAWIDRTQTSTSGDTDQTINKRAYEVWVSEVMLQQTRVSTVIPYFNNWISKWPTVQDLAKAEHEDVLAAWRGLGYYSRATRLHEGARAVMAKPSQSMPDDVSGLLGLPGIGHYTAGAIASIAFGRAEPVLDGNVARVLSRQLGLYLDAKDKRATDVLWKIADQLIKEVCKYPEVKFSAVPGHWNQAMMELGSTICTPRPKCEECPIQETCRAYGEGVALSNDRQSTTEVLDIEDACTLCEQLGIGDLTTIPEEDPSDEDEKPAKKRKAPTRQTNTLSNYFAISTPSASSNVDTEDEDASAGSKKRKVPGVSKRSRSVNSYCSLFPKKVAKKKAKEEECAVCLVEFYSSDGESKWLIEQRPATGLLASLWQFPQATLSAADMTAASRKASAQKYLSSLSVSGVDMTKARHIASFDPLVHVFTHLRLTMHAYRYRIADKAEADSLTCTGAPARKWVTASSMDNETLSTGMRKCWELIAKKD